MPSSTRWATTFSRGTWARATASCGQTGTFKPWTPSTRSGCFATTDYFYNGLGEGCIDRTVYFIHPGYLGQTQEAGRDQGHNTLEIALLAPLCEMAWHQGVDLYGYENNRVLAGAEYVAKYNLFQDVPFVTYSNESGFPSRAYNTEISSY